MVARQKNHRAHAFSAGGGKVVADAKVLPVDVQPQRPRGCSTPVAGCRDPAQHIFFLDDFGTGGGRDQCGGGQGYRLQGDRQRTVGACDGCGTGTGLRAGAGGGRGGGSEFL